MKIIKVSLLFFLICLAITMMAIKFAPKLPALGTGFFYLIENGEYDSAYDLTSKEFQQNINFSQFKKSLAKKLFTEYKSVQWDARKMDVNDGYVRGVVTLNNNKKIPIEIQFTKELQTNTWKIKLIKEGN